MVLGHALVYYVAYPEYRMYLFERRFCPVLFQSRNSRTLPRQQLGYGSHRSAKYMAKSDRIIGIGMSRWVWQIWVSVAVTCSGCASTRLTDTARSGMEQLLVSNAIDASLDKIDFESLSGGALFVDEKYLESTDKKYVVGSVRQRAFEAGCRLVDKPDEADIVLEIHSGAVGTDRSESFVGMPSISVPGLIPVQLPEIKLISQTTQYGTAKLGVVAYDAKTKQALSSGGLTRARSDNTNWTVLGIGPFNSGSIREEVALTKKLQASDQRILLSNRRSPVSPDQYSTHPGPSMPNATSEMILPASALSRRFVPNAMPPPAIDNYRSSGLPL